MSEEAERRLNELEKTDIRSIGRIELLEQKVAQMKEGFDYSRATGSKAWEAVASLRGELEKEKTRTDNVLRDITMAFDKMKRLEKDMLEKTKEATDAAEKASGHYHDITKAVLWGTVATLVVGAIVWTVVTLLRSGVTNVGP